MMGPSELLELVNEMPEAMKSNSEMQAKMAQELSRGSLGAAFGFLSQALNAQGDSEWAKQVGKGAMRHVERRRDSCKGKAHYRCKEGKL
jgi:uncharacterized protein HemY